jgi:hypothetical protein
MVATLVLTPSLPRWDDDNLVPEDLIAHLYQAGEDSAVALAATLDPDRRARLAAHCYRRSHLHRLGLAIASTCDQPTLIRVLGKALGTAFFVQSRARSQAPEGRTKITLAKAARPTHLRLVVSEYTDQ